MMFKIITTLIKFWEGILEDSSRTKKANPPESTEPPETPAPKKIYRGGIV